MTAKVRKGVLGDRLYGVFMEEVSSLINTEIGKMPYDVMARIGQVPRI